MTNTPFVRTVLGDLSPDELGYTHTHEHLLSDLSLPLPADATVAERLAADDAIKLDNLYAQRRFHYSNHDLRLDSESDAIEAMEEYRAAGGRSVVEATSIGLGRNPEGISRISRATGVNVVMGSSFYWRPYHPAWLDDLTQAQITELIVRDVTEGVGESGVRAGVIGEVGLGWPHHPVEERVLLASVQAQKETGAPLMIHPGRNPASPFRAMEMVERAGGDTARAIMSHVERTLFGAEDILRLAATGCFVEFDLFGQESSYYSVGAIDMPNDATRVDYIQALCARGHEDQILVAQDICHKTHMRRYGGEGYTHILDNIRPLMRRKGFTAEAIERITVGNPARALAFAAGR